jgi:hypothetical protein
MKGPNTLLFMCLAVPSALAQDNPPNISGIYGCGGPCQTPATNKPYILQTGSHLLCVNEVAAETNGELHWFSPGPNVGTWHVSCWGSISPNGAPIYGGTVRMSKDGSVGGDGAIYIDWQDNRGSTVTWVQRPSSIAVPNFSGHFSCTGNCSGDTTLVQNGSDVTCINDSHRDTDSHGKITGRRTFDGCWGLHPTVSEDMTQIDWHQGSLWIRH